MMIPQILGMRYYVNGSWQECLSELNTATQLESNAYKLVVIVLL